MRLIIGKPPDSPDFSAAPPWTQSRGLTELRLYTYAMLLSVALQKPITNYWQTWGYERRQVLWPWELGGMALLFIFLIVVHELTHAVLMPQFLSKNCVLGFWPARMLPYAYFDGEITRERLLVVCVAPFCFLSALPIALISAGCIEPSAPIASFITWNALACSLDIIAAAMLAFQTPPNVIMRSKGMHTFWKRKST